MYTKDSSIVLLILQYSNLGITLFFLILFAYRFYNLRFYSLTDKYKDYFPKMRLFFCLVYILSSISLFLYNVLTSSYDEKKWYEYILQGGGGQLINSIIMIIQLGVLRLQLKKQQPYSSFHIYYFVYVMILSIARFILTTIDVANGANDMANDIISLFIMIDSIAQMIYWYRHRLPQFSNPTHQEIDQSRHHSQFLKKRIENTKRSMKLDHKQNFPFITPYLSVQLGKINILLQRLVYEQQLIIDKSFLNESFLKESILQKQKSFIIGHQKNVKSQIVSNQTYSLEQIKKLYIICGRFDIKKQLQFDKHLTQFLKDLQQFLNELFSQKVWYQPNILKLFNIQEKSIQIYKCFYQKSIIMGNTNISMDNSTGYLIKQDKNSLYISLQIYKYMWVYDHYELYMRISIKNGQHISYPIKRYEEIQQLYHNLRKCLKRLGRNQQITLIPKRNIIFNHEDDQMQGYINEIQLYLRKLVNQQFLMEMKQLRQKVFQFLGLQQHIKINGNFNRQFYQYLLINKGKIKKMLIKEEYVTLYQFKFYKQNKEIKTIFKRFSQFQQLHHALQKWSKNRKIVLSFTLPEKVSLHSQIRHQKLKEYLQKVIQIKDIQKIYAANVFFDITLFDQLQDNMSQNKNESRDQHQQMYSVDRNTLISVTELSKQESTPIQHNGNIASHDSKIFNQILDDLGNQAYDY